MGRESLPSPGENTPDDLDKEVQYCPSRERQDVAYKLSSYLLAARSDKKAATLFSHTDTSSPDRKVSKKKALDYLQEQRRSEDPVRTTLSQKQQQQLNTIRQELAAADQVYLEEKKDHFTSWNRATILFKAKLPRINGLSKEEKVEMYREAGFSENEILNLTGKKLLISAGIGTSLSWISKGALIGTTTNETLIPFIENIPQNQTALAMGASFLINTASYAYLTEKNLQLTQKFGGSTNSTLTGFYMLGNRLFPDKTRDWVARGVPLTWNAIAYSGIYPLIVAGATESPTKIIAGSLITAGLNVVYAAGCEAFLRKGKRDKGKA